MEENTNNEQSLVLDEEQMHDVTGGLGSFATRRANNALFHQRRYLSEFDRHVKNGNYAAANQALNAANHQLQRANRYLGLAK